MIQNIAISQFHVAIQVQPIYICTRKDFLGKESRKCKLEGEEFIPLTSDPIGRLMDIELVQVVFALQWRVAISFGAWDV